MKQLYTIAVTRETTAFVVAESLEEAKADADEMSFNNGDYVFEERVHVGKAWGPPDDNEAVWTGGPDGEWVPFSTVREQLRPQFRLVRASD